MFLIFYKHDYVEIKNLQKHHKRAIISTLFVLEGETMENIVREDKRQELNRKLTGVIHKDRIWGTMV